MQVYSMVPLILSSPFFARRSNDRWSGRSLFQTKVNEFSSSSTSLVSPKSFYSSDDRQNQSSRRLWSAVSLKCLQSPSYPSRRPSRSIDQAQSSLSFSECQSNAPSTSHRWSSLQRINHSPKKPSVHLVRHDLLSSNLDIFLCLVETIKNRCPDREGCKDFPPSTQWRRREGHCARQHEQTASIGFNRRINNRLGLNWMPLWHHPLDRPSTSDRWSRLQRIKHWPKKPSAISFVTIFSLLTSISFYVSSRRSRICVQIERDVKISLRRPSNDDHFTVHAIFNWIFALSRLTNRIPWWDWFHWIQWSTIKHHCIGCRSQNDPLNRPFSHHGAFRLGRRKFQQKTSMNTGRNHFLSYNLGIFLYHVEMR